jgi:hypothetical protein
VKAHSGPFGDSANLDVRKVHGLHRTSQAQKSLYTHPLKLLGGVSLVESHFSLFGDNVSDGAR